MIPKYLHAAWQAIGPAMGNHLWQSTLFVVAAGLLTLMLRKHLARTRYWIWLAASVKFLIPFSLLVTIGSHLAWSRRPVAVNTAVYFVMEEISQPFTQSTVPSISHATSSTAFPSLIHALPVLLAALWFFGFLVVLLTWSARWRRICAAVRAAVPLCEGREVEALRRLERVGGARSRIRMLQSRASLEPGIFGIARPVLIWPEGISERLADPHLDAILAHELWHVRRRDNLAAAIHMVVEAIFWFHPLVWWLGARLVDERERACDEEVVALGSERQVYAESILKVCEFCVESPLACVSGVTGSDLKKRMVNIMTDRIARKLDPARKLLLSVAGLLAIAVPLVFGLLHATQSRAQSQDENAASAPAYQAVSIKPHPGNGGFEILFNSGGFAATNVTLQAVIRLAYGVEDDRISGAPAWVNSEKYDIEAKLRGSPGAEAPEPIGGIGIQQLRLMLQALLADRFKLSLHRETKELPVYVLVIAENGPKLQEAKPGGPEGPGNMRMGPGELTSQGTSLAPLVEQLSQRLGRTVLDKTGLTGNYDFTLRWMPDESKSPIFKAAEGGQQPPPPDSSGPSIFTSLQEQLGLKLEQQTLPMEVLVIDRVEMPQTENASGEPLQRVRVAPGVMNALVLKKVPPEYPETARVARIQGAVVLEATIGKNGDVENLLIISGHPQLVPAAIEAVKEWKYNPFLVNGEPVEVETRITVNFTLSE